MSAGNYLIYLVEKNEQNIFMRERERKRKINFDKWQTESYVEGRKSFPAGGSVREQVWHKGRSFGPLFSSLPVGISRKRGEASCSIQMLNQCTPFYRGFADPSSDRPSGTPEGRRAARGLNFIRRSRAKDMYRERPCHSYPSVRRSPNYGDPRTLDSRPDPRFMSAICSSHWESAPRRDESPRGKYSVVTAKGRDTEGKMYVRLADGHRQETRDSGIPLLSRKLRDKRIHSFSSEKESERKIGLAREISLEESSLSPLSLSTFRNFNL